MQSDAPIAEDGSSPEEKEGQNDKTDKKTKKRHHHSHGNHHHREEKIQNKKKKKGKSEGEEKEPAAKKRKTAKEPNKTKPVTESAEETRRRIAQEMLHSVLLRSEQTDEMRKAEAEQEEEEKRALEAQMRDGMYVPDELREVLRPSCLAISQVVGSDGIQLLEDMRTKSYAEVLCTHFKSSGDPSNLMEWDIWQMPFSVPLIIMGTSAIIKSPVLSDYLCSEQRNFKGCCGLCPNAQVTIAGTPAAAATVVLRHSAAPWRSCPGMGKFRVRGAPKARERTSTPPPSETIPKKAPVKVTVPVCRLPQLLLCCLYRACVERPDKLIEIVAQVPAWLARSARIYAPPHPTGNSGAPRSVTAEEEEFLRLELCLMLMMTGRVTELLRPTPHGWERQPVTARALLDIARCWSPVDAWQGMNAVAEFSAFAQCNPRALCYIELVCHLLDTYKTGKLKEGHIFDYLYNLHRAVYEAQEYLPKKRTRTTRINTHPFAEVDLQIVYDKLVQRACFSGASCLYDYRRGMESEEDVVAYEMKDRAMEDVLSLLEKGRGWLTRSLKIEEAEGAAAAACCVGDESALGLASQQLQGDSCADGQIDQAPECSRRFFGVHGGGDCWLMGRKDDLEKLRRVMTCIMWSGDKMPNRDSNISCASPFPQLLSFIKDPDDGIVSQAYLVLIRAISKKERKPTLAAQPADVADHLRAFEETVNAVFGNKLNLVMHLLQATWHMPPESYANVTRGSVTQRCMVAKPVVCGLSDRCSPDLVNSQILTFGNFAVHSCLPIGLMNYATPNDANCDNVTLCVLAEELAKRPELAKRHGLVASWLDCDSEFQPARQPITNDVFIPDRRITDALYAMCRDPDVPASIRLALFLNIHSNATLIEFPATWGRNWSFYKQEDFPMPGNVYDSGYAARAIVALVLHGATVDLCGPGDVPLRYTVETMQKVYVPHTTEETKALTDKIREVLPFSHSKDRLLPRLPTHECVVVSPDLPSHVSCVAWSPHMGSVNMHGEDVWFMGRYRPTKTSHMCRWCLDSSSGETRSTKLLEMVGCPCEHSATLGLSHGQCLGALAKVGQARASLCAVCLREHSVPWQDIEKVPVVKETMFNTWYTVVVDPPLANYTRPGVVVDPSLTNDTRPSVSCAACGTVCHTLFWLFLPYPVFLRFDFCGYKCLDAFEVSCQCARLPAGLRTAVYSYDQIPLRRCSSPRVDGRGDSPLRLFPSDLQAQASVPSVGFGMHILEKPGPAILEHH